MPEYPDITIYIEALEAHTLGKAMTSVRVVNPFVLLVFIFPVDVVPLPRRTWPSASMNSVDRPVTSKMPSGPISTAGEFPIDAWPINESAPPIIVVSPV